MLQVRFLEGFRGRREDVLLAKPGQKVGVLVELVILEELVQDYASSGQPMVRVILIVIVTKAIGADTFTAQTLIFRFQVASGHSCPFVRNFHDHALEALPKHLLHLFKA